MSKITESDVINDALVDTYRALRAINDATRPVVSHSIAGAGVRGIIVTRKRIKAAHRSSGKPGESFKQFAKHLADQASKEAAIAKQWLINKGIKISLRAQP